MRTLPQSDTARSLPQRLRAWLTCGLAPRQLAFTLALGLAIGCIPLLGVTTAICGLLAVLLRLNMPAIQAANWAAMPFQVLLLVPFLRLGQRLFPWESRTLPTAHLLAQVETAPLQVMGDLGSMFGHAMLGWLVTVGPALLLATLLLTPLMHRVSRLSAVAAD